jgi:8-oxo-dGTP pyrophosphatase MutT (NUDIX family)
MEDMLIIKRTGMHCMIKNQKGEFLVLKRNESDRNDPNFWDLPGGGIEINENLTEALKREIKEETNLKVANINLIGAYTCDEGRLQLCAISELKGGELQLSHEHSDYQWLDTSAFQILKPAGLHLQAAQYFQKSKNKIISYENLIGGQI